MENKINELINKIVELPEIILACDDITSKEDYKAEYKDQILSGNCECLYTWLIDNNYVDLAEEVSELTIYVNL